MRNLVTDVEGVRVGHAHDARLGSGTTAIVFDEPAVASVDVRGGGPGTHETDLLHPARTVERIDALTISGGSAFGLEAAHGVQAWLREQGRGFAIGNVRVPIVVLPTALTATIAPTVAPSRVTAEAEPRPPFRLTVVAP